MRSFSISSVKARLNAALADRPYGTLAHIYEPCTRRSLADLALKLQIHKAHELGVAVEDIRVDVHGQGIERWANRWLSWQRVPENPLQPLYDSRYKINHVGGDWQPLEDSVWRKATYQG